MWLLTIQQLKSSNPKWRLAGVEKLATMEDAKVLPPLISAARDPESHIRKLAVLALGKFKDEAASEALTRALSDENSEVRTAAAMALKQSRSKSAVSALARALDDPIESVRTYVAMALDALNWEPETDAQRVLRAVALGKLAEAARYKSLAVEPLLNVVRSGVYYKRLEAVEALSKIADARITAPLINALKDEDATVRTRIVEVLSNLGDARAVEPLIYCLRDPNGPVRVAAVEGLSHLGDGRAVKPLILLVKDAHPEVRKAAVDALGKMKSTGAVTALLETLQDADKDIREAAALALGKMGDVTAIPQLVLALADKSESVRQAAEWSLRKMDAQWEKSALAKRAIPLLEGVLEDDDYWVRQTATAVLKRLGGGDITPVVDTAESEMTTLTDRSYYRRRDAAKILAAALKDANRNLRLAAAEALGSIGQHQVQGALLETLHDQDRWVRRASAKTLDSWQWQPADDAQRAVYLIALGKWSELAACGESALGPLLETLQDGDWVMRRSAAEVLGEIQDTRSEAALATCLQDHHKPVRKAAAQALQKIGIHNLDESQMALLARELVN